MSRIVPRVKCIANLGATCRRIFNMVNKVILTRPESAQTLSNFPGKQVNRPLVERTTRYSNLPLAKVPVITLQDLKGGNEQIAQIIREFFQRGIPVMLNLGDKNFVSDFEKNAVMLFEAKNLYEQTMRINVGQKELTFPAGTVKAGYAQEHCNRESFLYAGEHEQNDLAHEQIMPKVWKNYYAILSDVKDALLQAINPGMKELIPVLDKTCTNLIAFHYFPAPQPKNNQQPRADYYNRLSKHIDKIEIFTLNLLPPDDQMEVFFNNRWHALRPADGLVPIIPGSQWKTISKALWNEEHPGIKHRIIATSEKQANSHRYAGLLALRLFPEEKADWRKQISSNSFLKNIWGK